jgi:outer membrane receptor protein involved in Fe transport
LSFAQISLLALLTSMAPTLAAAEDEAPLAAQLAQAESAAAEGEEAARAEDDVVDVDVEEEASSTVEGSSSEPPPGVEIMRVRGRGISQIQTELPSSVTQFDAATIEALGAQDVSDLAKVTPNVNIVQPGATQASFFVRGIGLQDFSSNASGAVTIFQDGVALNAPAIQTGQLFDIRNVEVVRGPQGFGPFRNASAGAIRVESAMPTGNYGAQLRATLGRYESKRRKGVVEDALIQDYEGYLEAPIVEDWLSSRFAFRFRDSDPYKKNGCGNAPAFSDRIVNTVSPDDDDAASVCGERGLDSFPVGSVSQIPTGLPDEIDFEDNWAARGTFRLQPPESELDLFLNLHGSRLDQDQRYGQAIGTLPVQGVGPVFGGSVSNGAGNAAYQDPDAEAFVEGLCQRDEINPGRCNVPGGPPGAKEVIEREFAESGPLDGAPYRGDYNLEGITTRDAWGGFLSGEMELGRSYDLSFLASFDGYERFRDGDSDFTPEVLFETLEDDEAWQTYEEVILSGELARHPVEWEVGGYYMHEELDVFAQTRLATKSTLVREYEQKIDSFAGWGSFNWDINDDLTLEAGLRFNWEKKEFDVLRESNLFGAPQPQVSIRGDQDETWQVPTGGLILTYHLNARSQVFAKYSRGFKAGHFNAASSGELTKPADEELNDAWEAGVSGSWLGGRLNGLAGFFYYRYQNYQVFLFTDAPDSSPVLEVINAEEAENYGIEVEGRLEPLRGFVPRAIEGLLLTGTFGWTHGEFLDFQNTVTRQIQTGTGTFFAPITLDFSGQQLLSTPEFTGSGAVQWTLDLGRWGFLVPRYDFSWTEDVFYGVNEGRGSSDLTGEPVLPDYAVGQREYWLHNARLAYRTPTGNIEVAAWIRNIEDTVYKSFAFDVSNFQKVVINFTGTPRTVGLDFRVTF